MAEDTDFLDGNAPEIGPTGVVPNKPRPLVPIPGSGKPKPSPAPVVAAQPLPTKPNAGVTQKKQGVSEDASTVRRPFTPVPQRKAGSQPSNPELTNPAPTVSPSQGLRRDPLSEQDIAKPPIIKPSVKPTLHTPEQFKPAPSVIQASPVERPERPIERHVSIERHVEKPVELQVASHIQPPNPPDSKYMKGYLNTISELKKRQLLANLPPEMFDGDPVTIRQAQSIITQ